jgi:uncharacterized membrane protein YeaQ/YmgE (transglycosylase-associated protein family)
VNIPPDSPAYIKWETQVSPPFTLEKKMINIIIWIIAGALIGWLASIIMRTNQRQGPIADIVVGIVGAFVGGYFLSPLFNVSTINEGNFSIPALLVSLGGAVILLAISKLFRNIVGFVVILLIALIIYIYFSCWSMSSTSAFCTTIKALPFLQ